MPVHSGFFAALPQFQQAHLAAYERSRGEREAVSRERKREREDRARVVAAAREQRQGKRELVQLLRSDADEQRQNARAQLDAVRSDPLYGLYRDWARRLDSGTVDDAEHWRRSGRLVPVTQRTKYTASNEKREIVDWTDILDRETQELGISTQDLPRQFERIGRQLSEARRLADAADRARRQVDADVRAIRAAA